MLVIPTFLAALLGASTPAIAAPLPSSPSSEAPRADVAVETYNAIGLEGVMKAEAFLAALDKCAAKKVKARMLAVADMTLPSTEKRLYLIDLEKRQLVLRTYVAHGQNTGELMAEHFSNKEGSHQSSLGLHRVGAEIVSPKHGAALLLHGLEKGVNDKALQREIIMHGADYVSEEFIAEHGRLGRSWGCPSIPRGDMALMIRLLADGGLLFVHGG